MSANLISSEKTQCRLCGGSVEKKFSKIILYKHEVNYFRCNECHSLQTETPYWLTAAYDCNLSNLDTGAAQRNIQNLVAVYTVAKILKLRNILDAGGGDGLLCRLLRDYELNCFVNDKYAQPTYAQGYSVPPFSSPDLVIAFEVLEHYPQPKEDIEKLFACKPQVLVATTGFYQKQDRDWWYLAPQSGQHVFFYSFIALELIAKTHGYELMLNSGFIIFYKKGAISSLRKIILKRALRAGSQRIIKMMLFNKPTPGVQKDHLQQLEISRSAVNKDQEKGVA